ncbi:MAG: ECF transporter S component [Candidatus Lokiarchaeota archaeon]|nr:ECF transporter S component [Candidatus Lokiarchaeota archaeon]
MGLKDKNVIGYLIPNNVLSISIIGIFAALICVLTMIISIPIPATQGFINIGDAGVMFTGLIFGPFIGGIAGGVGSALADIFLGYVIYAPATLIIKGLEGFLIGIIANPKYYYMKLNYRDFLAVVVGGLTMVFGYFIYEIFLWGFASALYEVILNGIVQFGVAGVISLLLILGVRKSIVQGFPQVFDKIFITKETENSE